MINSNWHPISYRFGVIAAYFSNIGHFAFWSHPLGGLGSTYNVHLGLIGKRVLDFLIVLIELLSLGIMAEVLRTKTDCVGANRRFSSIFTRSTSAVTSSEKVQLSLIGTFRKSTVCFPMSPRWTSYIVSKPPKGGSKCKVPKIWTISCNNFATVRDRLSVTINH